MLRMIIQYCLCLQKLSKISKNQDFMKIYALIIFISKNHYFVKHC